MLYFRSDYGEGCIPEILKLLEKTNDETHGEYGLDDQCKYARELVHSKMPDNDVDIHFIPGGTQTNLTIFKAILKSYEAVISPNSGHIACHETGAIEATGHKVITVKNSNGKITPNAIQKCFDEHMLTYEHMVYPKAVYISNSTELGTVYKRKELEALRKKCDELNLYLVMDGARIGTVLMSGVDYTLNDLPKWCDVFTIGGTKNGALFGEAIIISNSSLKENFRFVMKQTGSLLAKGWLLGIQFIGLFENDAFYKCADHENKQAQKIQSCLYDLKYPMFMRSETNQVFPIVTVSQFEFLSERVDFEIWEKREDMYVIRFVTSWHTKEKDVEKLCSYLKEASHLE